MSRSSYGQIEVRTNMSDMIRTLAKGMHDRAVEGERKLKEEEQKWKYDLREQYYCLITLVPPAQYEATTIEAVPGIGTIKGIGRSPDSAIIDLRYNLANGYLSARLVQDWDTARERANRVILTQELGLIHGS